MCNKHMTLLNLGTLKQQQWQPRQEKKQRQGPTLQPTHATSQLQTQRRMEQRRHSYGKEKQMATNAQASKNYVEKATSPTKHSVKFWNTQKTTNHLRSKTV